MVTITVEENKTLEVAPGSHVFYEDKNRNTSEYREWDELTPIQKHDYITLNETIKKIVSVSVF